MYKSQIGDTYTVRSGSSISDLLIIAFAILFAGSLWLFAIWALMPVEFFSTKLGNWLIDKTNILKNKFKHLGELSLKIFILSFITISLVCLFFIGKNTFHKVVPIGKLATDAKIVDREEELFISPKTITSKYRLTLQYTNSPGKILATEKDVSHLTYDMYKNGTYITHYIS